MMNTNDTDQRRAYAAPEVEMIGTASSLTACEDPDGSGPLQPPNICDIFECGDQR